MANALCASIHLLVVPSDKHYESDGPEWRRRRWGRQTEQNTPQLERLTHVTVTDPAHPLFGQTLEIVHRNSPPGKENLTLSLPNGQHRLVPRQVTDLAAPVSLQRERRHLSPISVRTILPLSQFVRLRFQAKEEKQDVPSDDRVRTDSPFDSRQADGASPRVPMAPVDATGSPTTGPAVGQTYPAKSSDKGSTKGEQP